MSLSPNFGAPLSTSTSPSPAEKASAFAPPTSNTANLSGRRPACCALRIRGDTHVVSMPAAAPLRNSLRSTTRLLDRRNHARAVAELIALHSRLLEQRQMEIRDRRAFRQHDMLTSELHLAVAAANHDVRLRIVVMQVAVA